MIIAFQNLFGGQYEGGANWLEVSLLALGTLRQPPRCLVLGATREMLPVTLRDAPHVEAVALEHGSETGLGRLRGALVRRALGRPWEARAITEVAGRYGVDLWVGFAGFEGLSERRPLLVWFPDFQFRHLPEMFDEQERRERERQWSYVAERAQGVLAISRAVAEDALAEHPQIAEKVHVCGFPPVFPASVLGEAPDEVRRRYHLPERFFLVSNQFWQHKNHALVFRALSRLKQCGKVAPVVAFTGRPHDYRRPDAFSEMLSYVAREGLHAECRFLGVVPRGEQLALVRAAEAVIQPSRFEGRGAIVEETTLLGAQLLCSDLPVHRELNAPRALFFSVEGVDELAGLLERRYAPSDRSSEEIAAESARLARDYGERLLRVCQQTLGQTVAAAGQ